MYFECFQRLFKYVFWIHLKKKWKMTKIDNLWYYIYPYIRFLWNTRVRKLPIFNSKKKVSLTTLLKTIYRCYITINIFSLITHQDTVSSGSFLTVGLWSVSWLHGWFLISDMFKRTLNGASNFIIICLQASEIITSRGNETGFCTC